MKWKLMLTTAAVALLMATTAHACPAGYVCPPVGVPVFDGNGPNCYHVKMPGDAHVYGVIFAETSTLAGVTDVQTLQSAMDNSRPIAIVAQASESLCDLNVGTVLSIKGISPAP